MNFAGYFFVFGGIFVVASFINAALGTPKRPTRADKYYARKAQEVLDSGKLDPYLKKPRGPRAAATSASVAEEPEWKKRIQLAKLLLETKIACEYCGEIVPPAARCSNCGAPSPLAK